MEALYIKLYEKYSKLKDTKDAKLDQFNQEQELKFVEFVTAAETLIKHVTGENKRLSEDIDELRKEFVNLRTAKDEQFNEFQALLMEEKQKNQQLSAEIEQLRTLQQERPRSSNRSIRTEEQDMNSNQASPSVSRGKFHETPMRMTRKRLRESGETGLAMSTPPVSQQSLRKDLLKSRSTSDVPSASRPQPECCRAYIVEGGPSKCLFQGLVECLIGMKLSIADQPERNCIRVVHQASGYSFSLSRVNKSASADGEWLYQVLSLGTFANVAPEWMRDVIIFSMSMCPIFFERVSRVIKHH